jgi:ArsR family transcriptional regulator, lead/cadmium/zinc/bismuth-responsive transcriptional repressor
MKASASLKVHRLDPRRIERIKKSIGNEKVLVRQGQLFAILADPTRLKVVMALRRTELCVHEITEIIGPSLSAVSHQLRLLKALRLVRFRKQGKEVYYKLDDEHVEKLIDVAAEHIREQ